MGLVLQGHDMKGALTLTGDDNNVAMPMTDAQINHLRRVLAWMRTEYTLDEHMQAGYVKGCTEMVKHGLSTPECASQVLQSKADEINRVPAYVRQGVKMLTKALREHDAKTGVVE